MSCQLSRTAGAILFALSAFASAETPTHAPAPAAIAAPANDMLDVGPYRVQMASQGTGPYTVIFESGFGRDLNVWRAVAPEVAKSNRAVTYSRAGHGRSAPRPGTPTLTGRTDELEELIAAAGLQPPFVLVGHSYGGFLIRSYAARHPAQIAGMVFVDPSDEHQNIELRKLDAAAVDNDTRLLAQCMPPKLQPELSQLQAILDSGKLSLAGPLPDVPVVVLTSVQRREQPQLFLETPAAVEVWRDLHARFFRSFKRGSHVVTPYSDHNIHQDEPQLVIAAIADVIAAAETARAAREGTAPGK
ncbi:alpha/beta hydrolase [Massilia aurea]|uniref:alpha/beta fold hydrolase n=1 Tax=Massilia aurea TaxID=373040 RepID=UPI0034620EAF